MLSIVRSRLFETSFTRRDVTSDPSQRAEGSSTDEYVFSNGRSISYIQGNNSILRHPGAGAALTTQANQFYRFEHELTREESNTRRNTEQNIRKRFMKPPRYPEYTDYGQRLKSFARWYKQKPDPTTLCNAGFFFTNQEDLVRCYQCGIGLKDFSFADNPLNEHVNNSPECIYLEEYLGQDVLSQIKKKVMSEDIQLSVNETSRYRHPEYSSYNIRLSSFSKWPMSLMQTPVQLAEAGLYYTGFDDHVRCFACDGGLKKWDPEDDPWTEHCRWFPECPFVLENKGEEYVKLVQTVTAHEIQKRLETEEKPANTSAGPDISSEMERLTFKDHEFNANINDHRETCLEMGYKEKDFEIAARKLASKGNVKPTLIEIIDTLETGEKDEAGVDKPGSMKEENIRLKSLLYCMTCKVNAVNALFLPCTHHRMCMICAEQLAECPVCKRQIRQKIKTYLV
ncbi:baculoviral IAP repeat-containing protein 7-B-like [Ruditapes philippinarum]|uniref:baculoviral IAP repeat-containing protein 7-B-like n=1 Tax=Ruditapes philippinarum TaxID=129788 RepID=UPI00295AD42B|nr:baculoviral IAP repeat-containing protein 7-B-like [Ruditapes philippinarum]